MELGLLHSKKTIEVRNAIFNEVAKEVNSEWIAKIQPLIGVWKSGVNIKHDINNNFSISETGVLSFHLIANENERIVCSIFMFMGEIRIGIVFENKKTFDKVKEPSMKFIYKHEPVFKTVGNEYMIDWIFRDEWVAKLEIMKDMLFTPNIAGAVADAVAKQTMHIIISTVVAMTDDVKI